MEFKSLLEAAASIQEVVLEVSRDWPAILDPNRGKYGLWEEHAGPITVLDNRGKRFPAGISYQTHIDRCGAWEHAKIHPEKWWTPPSFIFFPLWRASSKRRQTLRPVWWRCWIPIPVQRHTDLPGDVHRQTIRKRRNSNGRRCPLRPFIPPQDAEEIRRKVHVLRHQRTRCAEAHEALAHTLQYVHCGPIKE